MTTESDTPDTHTPQRFRVESEGDWVPRDTGDSRDTVLLAPRQANKLLATCPHWWQK